MVVQWFRGVLFSYFQSPHPSLPPISLLQSEYLVWAGIHDSSPFIQSSLASMQQLIEFVPLSSQISQAVCFSLSLIPSLGISPFSFFLILSFFLFFVDCFRGSN